MSRIGKQPIQIPETVTVALDEKRITIKGPKGELRYEIFPNLRLMVENKDIRITRTNDDDKIKALHGLMRSLIANAVIGVEKGFDKRLVLVGTGYRVKKQGEDLILSLGFSHPVTVKATEGINLEISGEKEIIISGIDKQQVGQVAANIRSLKKPEPYKGKGIRYFGEIVRQKPGKAAKIGVTSGEG